MTKRFDFTLKGKNWFSLWAMFLVPTLLLQGLSLLIRFPENQGLTMAPLLLSLAIIFLQILVSSWFEIPIYRAQINSLSVGDRPFEFKGDSLTFTAMNALGFLLSVVTLGIYLPWYLKRVLNYLASQTSFEGVSAGFRGRPLPLLGIIVLWIVVMFVVVVGTVVPLALYGSSVNLGASLVAAVVLPALLVFVLVAPLVYLLYRWTIDYTWNGLRIRWATRFWRSTGMILGQVGLCIVTVGIYTPAACLRLYGYFITRTLVEKDGASVVTLSYGQKAGPGFGLCWGQLLLTVVTLGFYYPWALEKVGSRLAAATLVEVPEVTPV